MTQCSGFTKSIYDFLRTETNIDEPTAQWCASFTWNIFFIEDKDIRQKCFDLMVEDNRVLSLGMMIGDDPFTWGKVDKKPYMPFLRELPEEIQKALFIGKLVEIPRSLEEELKSLLCD